MFDALERFPAALADFASIEALQVSGFQVERAEIIARLRARVEEARSDLDKERCEFDELLRRLATERAASEELHRLAQAAAEARSSRAEMVHARIAALELQIAQHHELQKPDVLLHFREGMEIALSQLELLATFGQKLQALAGGRPSDQPGILRARPVKGKIDHDALSREFMARFPKIRAALAK